MTTNLGLFNSGRIIKETTSYYADLAEQSAADALVSEQNAAASEAATAADALATSADVVLTHADVVLTNADVVATNADVLATNADVILAQQAVTDAQAEVVLATIQADDAEYWAGEAADAGDVSLKLNKADDAYSGLSEGEVSHVLSGGGTATINYLAANSGGNTHLISEAVSGTIVITLGADWPDAHDAVTLKIDPTNLTGLTWTDQASFVNVGAGLDYDACAAFDAGTAQLIIRIEKIGGELFYFESSIL